MTGLVFGRTGQVARALAETFERSAEVEFLGRTAADLSDPDSCARAIESRRPSFVVNAAAWTAVDAAEDDERAATVVNGAAPGAMARACAALGVPFVHLSTDYVFDGTGTTPWLRTARPRPMNAYGRSKLAGESAVSAAGGRFVILRTAWVFSEHGANFVKTMLRLGRERERLSIVGDQIGGPTAAADIARAVRHCLARFSDGPEPSGIHHFSGEPHVSWADFARTIFEFAELPVVVEAVPTEDYPTPAPRPRNSRLEVRDTERILGLAAPDWRIELGRIVSLLTEDPTPHDC